MSRLAFTSPVHQAVSEFATSLNRLDKEDLSTSSSRQQQSNVNFSAQDSPAKKFVTLSSPNSSEARLRYLESTGPSTAGRLDAYRNDVGEGGGRTRSQEHIGRVIKLSKRLQEENKALKERVDWLEQQLQESKLQHQRTKETLNGEIEYLQRTHDNELDALRFQTNQNQCSYVELQSSQQARRIREKEVQEQQYEEKVALLKREYDSELGRFKDEQKRLLEKTVEEEVSKAISETEERCHRNTEQLLLEQECKYKNAITKQERKHKTQLDQLRKEMHEYSGKEEERKTAKQKEIGKVFDYIYGLWTKTVQQLDAAPMTEPGTVEFYLRICPQQSYIRELEYKVLAHASGGPLEETYENMNQELAYRRAILDDHLTVRQMDELEISLDKEANETNESNILAYRFHRVLLPFEQEDSVFYIIRKVLHLPVADTHSAIFLHGNPSSGKSHVLFGPGVIREHGETDRILHASPESVSGLFARTHRLLTHFVTGGNWETGRELRFVCALVSATEVVDVIVNEFQDSDSGYIVEESSKLSQFKVTNKVDSTKLLLRCNQAIANRYSSGEKFAVVLKWIVFEAGVGDSRICNSLSIVKMPSYPRLDSSWKKEKKEVRQVYSTLHNCIHAKKQGLPLTCVRDSKLTRILQDCFYSNGIIRVFSHISGDVVDLSSTVSLLDTLKPLLPESE